MERTAESDKYKVEFVRQSEIEDWWRVTRKSDGEVWYDHTRREYFSTAEDVLETAELYGHLN